MFYIIQGMTVRKKTQPSEEKTNKRGTSVQNFSRPRPRINGTCNAYTPHTAATDGKTGEENIIFKKEKNERLYVKRKNTAAAAAAETTEKE